MRITNGSYPFKCPVNNDNHIQYLTNVFYFKSNHCCHILFTLLTGYDHCMIFIDLYVRSYCFRNKIAPNVDDIQFDCNKLSICNKIVIYRWQM